MTTPIGLYEGHRYTDGTLAFYPIVREDASIAVHGYVLPVVHPAEDWYFTKIHFSADPGIEINPMSSEGYGCPVFATCGGLVVYAGLSVGKRWDRVVITASIDRGHLYWWRYAQLGTVGVVTGQVVPAGYDIGTMGRIGLHLDVWRGCMLAAESFRARGVEWLDPLDVWSAAGYVWDWGQY